MRETVPDSILEQADEVELVDLPPEDLLQRLREGKVYVPQQAERAVENFFRKGNLIALRELALRLTAQHVWTPRCRTTCATTPSPATWPVSERLAGLRRAQPAGGPAGARGPAHGGGLRAEWIVAYVETPGPARLSAGRTATASSRRCGWPSSSGRRR